MSQNRTKIILDFLKSNKNILQVDWENDELTVYFLDNPTEPFSKFEFVSGSPTRMLLEDLENKLESVQI